MEEEMWEIRGGSKSAIECDSRVSKLLRSVGFSEHLWNDERMLVSDGERDFPVRMKIGTSGLGSEQLVYMDSVKTAIKAASSMKSKRNLISRSNSSGKTEEFRNKNVSNLKEARRKRKSDTDSSNCGNIFAPRCRFNEKHVVSIRKMRKHEDKCPSNPNRPVKQH